MGTGWLVWMGDGLATVFTAYSILFLAAGAVAGIHIGAMVLLWYHVARNTEPPPVTSSLRRTAPFWRWAAELSYGLLNPILYLVILIPNVLSLQRHQTVRQVLTTTAWTLLVAVWAARLMGRPTAPARLERARRWVVALLIAGFATVLAHAALDLWSALDALPFARSSRAVVLLFLVPPLIFVPVYAVPSLLIVRHLQRAWTPERWTRTGATAFFAAPSVTWPLRIASVALLLVTLTVAGYRLSTDDTQRFVLDRRDAILDAASTYDVDPGVLAAIMYVTHRDQLSPFRFELERLLMGGWAGDESLGPGLNISVGVMQIKPMTAGVACRLRENLIAPEQRWVGLPKHQMMSAATEQEWLLPPERLAAVPAPIQRSENRRRLVADLLDDRKNIATAAYLLALHQMQWEHADPAWSIRQRPDIQATLYQLGFDRSRPHGAPRSNAFGTRVLDVYRAPWIRGAFPKPMFGQSADARLLPRGRGPGLD